MMHLLLLLNISLNIYWDFDKNIFSVVCALGTALGVGYSSYCGSRVLLERLLERILHAPMAFFDTTPLGRIINRFSKDIDIVDADIPIYIYWWIFATAPVLTTIILIAYSTLIFLPVVIPIIILFFIVQVNIVCTSIPLK